jgi:pyruvate dehydrogenase E2 component (dihydrolipoamide acetyltransferase)
MTEVLLPDIGDFHDVEVIEILVQPGDTVGVEDPLIMLESDKASMEIPSPAAGTVGEIRVGIGDRINKGTLILLLETDEAPAAPVDATDEPAVSDGPLTQPAGDAPAPEAPSMETPVEMSAGDGGEVRAVTLPDIGDFKDVEVIELLVNVGDSVVEEQSLLMLESDKATMEIPAPFAGVVESIDAAVGDRINQGDRLMALLTPPATEAAPAPAPAAVVASESAAVVTDSTEPERPAGEKEPLRRPVVARPEDAPRGKAHASPGVRRFARELGVDLYHVPGSGPKSRITKEDVQAYVKDALASGAQAAAPSTAATPVLPGMPEIDFSKFGEIEEQPLGRIKKLSGAHLHRAWLNVPHVTQFDEADITELEEFRRSQKDEASKAGVKLTFMPFLMKAVCKAMAAYPQVNSSLSADGEKLIVKKYVHIGIAVDTPNGLVVPVIRDVDRKGIFDLAGDLAEMSEKARAGKLSPTDMQGGSLSISSLGGIGGTQFTPIVNAPEVAILGVSRAAMQPRWDGNAFQPRLIMPFSLSYDHRVIDGAEGVRFTTYLGRMLGDIRKLLL